MKKTSFAAIFLAALLLLSAAVPVFAADAGEDPAAGTAPETAEGAPGETDLTARAALTEGFPCEELEEPNSGSIFMISLDTGSVLYTHNPDERRPMASTTKIMTYIAVIEAVDDPVTTVVRTPASVIEELEGTNSSAMGLVEGEELTVLQLLHMMMIPSANDAALCLAKYVDSLNIAPGDPAEDTDGDGVMSCIELMNRKAKELGCTNSHFSNPHGLYGEDHYTTARELCTITKYAMTLPYFREIVGKTEYTLPPTNRCSESRWYGTTNRLMVQSADEYWMYATGVKTGSLDEAGYCVVASGSYEGSNVLCVCLGAPMYDSEGYMLETRGEMYDARTLMRWAFLNFEDRVLVASGDLLGEIDLKYVWNKDRLQLLAAGNLTVSLPSDYDESAIERKFDLPDFVEAPVEKGQEIGSVSFYHNGSLLATLPLVAAENAERSEIIQTVEKGKEVLSSPWFLGVAGGIALLTAVYLIAAVAMNRRRRKEHARRVKKYRDGF